MTLLPSPRDLGLAIREARRAQRLTQAALAAQAGVSREWIVAVERGNAGAEIGRIMQTLAVLGLRLETAARTPSTSRTRKAAAGLDAILAKARKPIP